MPAPPTCLAIGAKRVRLASWLSSWKAPNAGFAREKWASGLGENATEALTELQRLYPPIEGSVRRDTYYFYGGIETCAAKVDGIDVFFKVAWPFLNNPADGTSDLFLFKFRSGDRN